MKKTVIQLIVATAVFLTGVRVNGQDDVGSRPSMGLRECVRTALERNPALRAADESSAMAESSLTEARSSYYPRISANAGYSRWQRMAFLPSGIPLPPGASPLIGPTDDQSVGVSAQYVLFDSGESRGRIKSANAMADAAGQDERRLKQDVVLAVSRAYYECLAARESCVVAESIFGRANDHLKLAKDRIQAGAAPAADESRAQVEVANGKLGLLRSESRLRMATGELNTVMGLPTEAPLSLRDGRQEIPVPTSIDIDEMVKKAVKARPEVAASMDRIRAAQSEVMMAKSEFGPRVMVQAGYDRRDGDVIGPEDEWSAGIALELPLFEGFKSVGGLSRARAGARREEYNHQRLLLAVRQEIWNAQCRLVESHEALKATETLAADAAISLTLCRDRYKAGAGTMTEVLDAQTAFAKAEVQRVEARKDCLIAQVAMDKAIGRVLPATGE